MDKIEFCANVCKLRKDNPEMSVEEAHKQTRELYNKSWNITNPEKPKTFQEKKKAVEKFYKQSI